MFRELPADISGNLVTLIFSSINRSTAFGLDTGILKEEKESVFRRMIKKAHRMTTPLFISYIIHEFLPPIAKRFRPSHMRSDVVEYFSSKPLPDFDNAYSLQIYPLMFIRLQNY